jgi:hypothetical protein
MSEQQTSSELRQDYIKRTLERSRNAYKNHELIDRGDRWFHLARRYPDTGQVDSYCATDIFCGHFGEIVVGGDVDTMVFAHYGDSRDIERRLKWIGRCKDLEYYVAQKASIGMTDNNALTYQFDPKIAAAELREHMAQFDGDQRDVMNDDAKEEFDRIIGMVESGEAHQAVISHELYHSIDYDYIDELGQFGTVLSSRVIHAFVAIEKLCDLLKL